MKVCQDIIGSMHDQTVMNACMRSSSVGPKCEICEIATHTSQAPSAPKTTRNVSEVVLVSVPHGRRTWTLNIELFRMASGCVHMARKALAIVINPAGMITNGCAGMSPTTTATFSAETMTKYPNASVEMLSLIEASVAA